MSFKFSVEGKTLKEAVTNLVELTDKLRGESTVEVTGNQELELEPVVKAVKAPKYEAIESVAPLKDEMIENSKPLIETEAPTVEPAPTVASDLDAEGLPWNKEIHSSGKSLNVKGIWNKKRGVPVEEMNRVKEEMRNAMYQSTNPAPVAAPPATLKTLSTEPLALVPEVVQAPVTAAQPVATPPQPTTSTSHAHSVETFVANFPMVLATLISEGKVTQEYVEMLNKHFGVAQIFMVTDAQKAEVFQSFVDYKIITKV